MNHKPFVGAYWTARKETHRECVTRTLKFMEAISKESDLNNWFKGGRTRKEANVLQELSMEAIGKRMKPVWKRCKGIPDPQLTDKLGFSFGVWNGDDEASASISVHCGLYALDQKNIVSLTLPKQPFPGDEVSRARFKRVLDIFAKIWDPDFAIVATDQRHRLAFEGRDWRNKKDVWNECITKSAWLLYRRGEPLVINPIVES